MPWLDPARMAETGEDQALRAELRAMLGLPEAPAQSCSAEMSALADDLLREASRRQHTPPLVRPWRAHRLLMAAGLPLALAAAGLGAWGYQQKRKVEALAAQYKSEREALERSHQQALQRERDLMASLQRTGGPSSRERLKPKGPVEFVAPAPPVRGLQPNVDVQQVNQPR